MSSINSSANERKLVDNTGLLFKELKLSYHNGYVESSMWFPQYGNLN